jgi:hypothetical protein
MSLPYLRISSSRLLTSQYKYEKKDEPNKRYKSIFKITDIATNNTLWEDVMTGLPFADLYRISSEWLLKVRAPHIAGNYETNTIFNYETGEEVSFAPEHIIGYGDGVVLTSQQTNGGFTGITAWTTDKNILYQDKKFPVTAAINRKYKIILGRPVVYFSYYDYPYIYINIGHAGVPYGTLILNLHDGTTYISPDEGYHLLGIFDAE